MNLAGVTADGVILLVLVAAVASQRVSQLARLLIATFAFMCAWLLAAGFAALRAPGWTTFTGCAVIVVSIVVMIVSLHLWTQAGEGGQSDGEHRGDHGGGSSRRKPDAPRRGGGGDDPSWWPEFERQLALYVAERDGGTQQPAVLPGRSGEARLGRAAEGSLCGGVASLTSNGTE
jgi:hypothetical protein